MFSGSTNLNNYASCGDMRNVKMPQVSSKEAYDVEQNDKDLTDQQKIKKEPIFALLDQQIPNLVTLSLLPRSQWQSLTNIDIIKVCFIEGLLLLHCLVPLDTCRTKLGIAPNMLVHDILYDVMQTKAYFR